MKRFIIRFMIYMSPLIFILGYYIYKDPFKVLYHYDYFHGYADTSYYELNDDYVSTQTLIQNYPKYDYDSYILGGSRSDNYQVSEFGRHVNSNKCYHYNAAFESLYGIERKMQFLNKKKYKIKNALIIIDHELMAKVKDDEGHMCVKHPSISGKSMFSFQLEFLKAYLDKDFLFAYFDLNFSGRLKPYMVSSNVMKMITFHYDIASNEVNWVHIEEDIKNNKYYPKYDYYFYKRDTNLHYAKKVIGPEQIRRLKSIKSVLAENHTDYRIVISPLYNQLKLDSTDLNMLHNIFDKEFVFDFSGINDITNNKYNYYEVAHYRPPACTQIMNIIYKK